MHVLVAGLYVVPEGHSGATVLLTSLTHVPVKLSYLLPAGHVGMIGGGAGAASGHLSSADFFSARNFR
jgi:hypothetical protein